MIGNAGRCFVSFITELLVGVWCDAARLGWRLVTEHAMESKCQFYALELMSLERAAVARKEMEYWLNEAEEWAQLRKAGPASTSPEPERRHGSRSADEP
jgi:hypothetical protein